MLGAPSARTSRPRAPSRAGSSRRSTTNDEDLRRATNTPPPPYDPRSSNLKQLQNVFGESEQRPVTLLGSSVLATAQMLGYELPEKISEVPDDQALQQKSREELFELLRNAETLIRTHETELNLAALAGEALLRENNDLRARHDLLADSVKPSFDSLRAFARPADASSSLEQDLVSSAPPTPAVEPAELSLPSTPPRKAMPAARSRRLSTSPEQIAVLNTQNEELQGRLERIVAEATETDRDSKRMLRNLQREIEGLRNELEDTQRRNAELETLAQRRKAKEPAQPRRRTSRAHLQALIEDPPSTTSDGPVRDFAPPRYLSRTSIGLSTNAGGTPSLSHDGHFPSPSSSAGSSRSQDGEDEEIFGLDPDRSRLASCSAEEFSLLAQILSKVKELEDAKNTFSASQRFMQERLDAAARDASEMKQKYDGLQLEEVEGVDDNGDTVRFFSWRGTASVGPSTLTVRRITSPTIGDGISTVNLPDSPFLTSVSPHLVNIGNPKSRKFRQPLSERMFIASPVVERNDPFLDNREDNERTVRPSPRQKPSRTPPSTLRSAFDSVDNGDASLVHDEDYMTAAGASFDPEQPTMFGRDAIGTSSEPNLAGLGAHVRTRTLDEELGRDFGGSWRAPVQLSFMENSLSASTTNSSVGPTVVVEDVLAEHPAMAALRQALDPSKAGCTLEPDQHILPQGSLASAPVGAFQLLGRAVAARPARWLSRGDGQPKRIVSAPAAAATATSEDPWETTFYSETVDDTACDPEEGQEEIEDESAIDATRLWVDKLVGPHRRNRLANARRRRMSAISRGDSLSKKDGFDLVEASEVETEASDQDLPLTSRLQERGVALVVEVWLFLQFVIVLGVFVFVMARKGPRAVLGEPPSTKRR